MIEKVRWRIRELICGLVTRHRTDIELRCEPECCGASVLWLECRCLMWTQVAGQPPKRSDDVFS